MSSKADTPEPAKTRLMGTRRLLRRFVKTERGATAVEFAIVGGPFLYLMFAILELGLVFWSSQVLETAVANASREIYTGQFQTSAANANKTDAQLAAQFKTNMCNYVKALFDCNAEVSVDIRTAASFSSANSQQATNNGNYDTSNYGYQRVGTRQIGVVTAAMQYKLITRVLPSSSGMPSGYRLIMATSTFKTEPY